MANSELQATYRRLEKEVTEITALQKKLDAELACKKEALAELADHAPTPTPAPAAQPQEGK